MTTESAVIDDIQASAYTIPTETPESDGTLRWDSTTLLLVEVSAAQHTGVGYSYTAPAAARLITDHLSEAVIGESSLDVPGVWEKMTRRTRNLGRPGLVSTAIAAVDNALWDLKARILDVPLARLFGMARDRVPVYASGGFTSYDGPHLKDQLARWAEDGFDMVKMKVGREPGRDGARVELARGAVGPDVRLFVDANGAYETKQAIELSHRFADYGVSWFEEPVSSDDLDGLALIRGHVPMEVTAGEYGYDIFYFDRMLAAGAVDVLQVDVTRCAGTTEFLRAAALCRARNLPMSSHTAPAQHLHLACALPELVHMEYFHDHVLIEDRFFENNRRPEKGVLTPDLTMPGNGLQMKETDLEHHRVA